MTTTAIAAISASWTTTKERVSARPVNPVRPTSHASTPASAESSATLASPSPKRNAAAAVRVVTALVRMEQGNFSNSKGIGGGVLECRIDFGPGYRIYFGRNGDSIVILLGRGTKKRQQQNIEAAKMLWKDYKRRKRQES